MRKQLNQDHPVSGRRTRQKATRYAVALLCGLGGLHWATAASAAEDWHIGALFPMTGNQTVEATEALEGAEVAVDMVNDKGGVNGHKIILDKVDATTPATATTEARRLVTRENLKFLTGTMGSSLMLSIAAVANQFHVPYWEGSSTADDLTAHGYKYAFRMNDDNSIMAQSILQNIQDLIVPKVGKPLKDLKIAIVHEDGAFGSSIAKDLGEQLKAKGSALAADEPYSVTTADFSSLVLDLKNLNPDVLVVGHTYNDAVLFWRQARNANYNPPYVIAAGTSLTSPDYRKAVGTDADGIMVCDVPGAGAKPGGLSPEAAALLPQFQERYRALSGKSAAGPSIRHFSAMYVLLTQILPKAGSFDPDKIRDAAMSLDEPFGSTILGYGIKFGEDGQNTRSFDFCLQWQKGAMQVVWPKQFATAEPVMMPLPSWADRDKMAGK